MKLSREAKIGITATIAIIIFIWGLNYLKGKNIFSAKNNYYVIYERVDGLKTSSTIVVNGFKIGQIDQIQYLPVRKKVLVEFFVDKDFVIPKNTMAKLVSLDLMSPKSIELVIPDEITDYYETQDTLVGIVEPGLTDLVSDLGGELEGTLTELDSTVKSVNAFFQGNILKELELTMKNLTSVSWQVNRQLKPGGDINDLLANLNNISENIDGNRHEIDSIIDHLSIITGDLTRADIDETIRSLDTTLISLNSILTGINDGKGTVGSLVASDSLHTNLLELTNSLDLLLKDLNEHPGRYVNFSLFGGKE